jgi:hypothetical protein
MREEGSKEEGNEGMSKGRKTDGGKRRKQSETKTNVPRYTERNYVSLLNTKMAISRQPVYFQ